MTQFAGWLAQAQAGGMPEPTAMVLATTSAGGRPRARTVLLKAHGPEGFTFYTNRTSRKGQDLQVHPRACAVFPWYALGRQVTAEGGVRMMSQASSEPYFRSRPRGSQIGAWASRQSQVIGSRAELDRRCRGTGAALARGTSRCPISGAGSCSSPRRSNSGSRAPTGCMTGCATGGTATAGSSSGFLPRGQASRFSGIASQAGG